MSTNTPANGAITAQGLVKTYMRGQSPVHALAGINLSLPQGTQVAIMGPSGSGKTTLLHCLAGVLRPTAGRITVGGVETTSLSERAMSAMRLRSFGFVFQDGQLLPELPCEENIAMPLMLAGAAKAEAIAKARSILANLGLDGAGRARPGQLSGGQAQRVAIGRALATDPAVIFADEPTGALDPDTGRVVMALLEEVARESNAALIVITHDMAVAARAQRAYELYDGTLHEVEDASALTQRAEAGHSGDEAGVRNAIPEPPPAPADDEGAQSGEEQQASDPATPEEDEQ